VAARDASTSKQSEPGRRSSQRRKASRSACGLSVSLGVALGSFTWTPAAAADVTGGPTVLPEPPPPLRRVIFETTGQSASLERNEPQLSEYGWHLGWRPICTSPCAADIPVTGLYRVSGPGVRSSRAFQLPNQPNAIYVQANPGSSTAWGWGLAGMIVAGSVFLPTSLVLLLNQSSCDTSPHPDCHAVLTQAGIVTAVLTAASGLAGLYFVLSNKTDVTLTPRAAPAARQPSIFGLRLSPEGVAF